MSFFNAFAPDLDKIDFNNQNVTKSLKDKITRQWQDTFDHPTLITLYSSLIKELRLFRLGKSQPEKLYYFLMLLNSFDYKAIYDEKFHHALLIHTELLEQEIDLLMKESNTQLIHNTSPSEQGDLREMISFLIKLYFYHPSYHSDGYNELQCIGGNLAFKFLNAYPYQDTSNIIISLLPSASEPLKKYTQLINDIVCNEHHDEECNLLLYILLSEMIGFYSEKSDFFYKKSKEVLKLLQPHILLWNDKQLAYFVMQGILNVFSIYPDISIKIAELNSYIAQLSTDNCKEHIVTKRVKQYNQEIAYIENNPRDFLISSYDKAAKTLMVKNNTITFLQNLANAIPDSEESKHLNHLVEQILTLKNTPKVFPINKTPKIKFSDLHFKLLVIEELMYNKAVLTPKFDLDAFAAEYHQREIDKEQEGYNVIPEVLAYFKGLDISQEQLAQVTALTQDCGIDGGAEIYAQLWPFWDPGCGDEVLQVSNKALKDLALLPNLKQVTGLEHSKPSKKLINGFKEHQIQLIKQDV